MADLPHPWGAYLRAQSELSNSTEINDRNWGLEACLNSILESGASAPTDSDMDRTISSAARGNRYRAMLRRKFISPDEPQFDPRPSLDARDQLRVVHSIVTDAEWEFLSAVAAGYEYDKINVGLSVGALRVKMLRLRERIAKAA
jgi:hypothetical protein